MVLLLKLASFGQPRKKNWILKEITIGFYFKIFGIVNVLCMNVGDK